MQVICQWVLVVQLVAMFFGGVYTDFYGIDGGEPHGFSGFVITCLVMALLAGTIWGAGGFSCLLGI